MSKNKELAKLLKQKEELQKQQEALNLQNEELIAREALFTELSSESRESLFNRLLEDSNVTSFLSSMNLPVELKETLKSSILDTMTKSKDITDSQSIPSVSLGENWYDTKLTKGEINKNYTENIRGTRHNKKKSANKLYEEFKTMISLFIKNNNLDVLCRDSKYPYVYKWNLGNQFFGSGKTSSVLYSNKGSSICSKATLMLPKGVIMYDDGKVRKYFIQRYSSGDMSGYDIIQDDTAKVISLIDTKSLMLILCECLRLMGYGDDLDTAIIKAFENGDLAIIEYLDILSDNGHFKPYQITTKDGYVVVPTFDFNSDNYGDCTKRLNSWFKALLDAIVKNRNYDEETSKKFKSCLTKKVKNSIYCYSPFVPHKECTKESLDADYAVWIKNVSV